MAVSVYTYAQRPELWEHSGDLAAEVWPECNRHGGVLNENWGRLTDVFAEFQFVLYDEDDGDILAEGHTAPCPWDGTLAGLGDGIDDMFAAGFRAADAGEPPRALCAPAAEIRPRYQGRGLAGLILDATADLGRRHRLSSLIAPVPPSLKERYPITPIERYVAWTRGNGQPFDPWIRTHTRRGGQLVKPVPHSMRIAGTVAGWEGWTAMAFPDDGEYVFPRGLALLSIDRARDVGSYWEPNVWIVHRL